MGVQLKVVGGPHAGKSFLFTEHDSFIVGRGKQAHFRLPHDDQYFSRSHFMVEVNPPLCRLLDLGSRNGTKVNGQRVTSIDLKDGDTIAAGKTLIQVMIALDTPPVVLDPAVEPTVLTDAYRPSGSPQTEPADVAGFELLPAAGELVFIGPVADPHGYLPADYLHCIRAHSQPIAGYHLVRELGRGGMGTVYQAIRDSDRSIVALKTVLPGTVINPRDQQRFLREADILQKLLHPQIVSYRESGESNGLLYFSMEYVPGNGADQLVKQQAAPLTVVRAVKIVLQLLSALRYAHTEGFVHRDIKPSNVLVVETGREDVVKLADFGLARAYQASGMSGLTMTGDIGGTIGYMSPEQITNFRHALPATDQYAAAATLYYLISGRFIHDFPDDPGKQLTMILDQQPVPVRDRRPDVPSGLAAAIHRALEHDPQARFPDVRAFYAAIEPYQR